MLPLQDFSPAFLLFSFIGALAVAILIKRPGAGLLLLLALTPVESVLSLTFSHSKAAKLILTGLTAGAYFLAYAGMPTRPFRYPYLWSQILFCVSGALATVGSIGPADSALGLLQLLVVFSLCYLIARSPLTEKASIQMLRLLVLAAAVIAPLAILQTFFGFDGFLGSVEQQADAADGLYDLANGLHRSAATFNGANSAAAFFGTCCVIAILHAAVFPATRLIYAGLAALIGSALVSTFSRGAFLGAAISISLLLPVRRPIFKWIAIAVFLTVTAGTLILFPPDALKVLARPGQGTLSRLVAWQESAVILRDHWVAGVGIYGFKPYVESISSDPNVLRQPHNGFLKAMVEQGFMGGLAYLLFVLAFARTCYVSLREEASGTPRWFILAAVAGVGTAMFIQELFDAGFVAGGSSLAVMLSVLIGVQCRLLRPPAPARAQRAAPVLSLASRARMARV
jgi:O-antigen ligase